MNKQHLQSQYLRISKNFMTPDVLKVETTDDCRILELSTGFGIDGQKIYGVTEFEQDEDGKLQTTRRSQMHNTKQSATKHFNNLK